MAIKSAMTEITTNNSINVNPPYAWWVNPVILVLVISFRPRLGAVATAKNQSFSYARLLPARHYIIAKQAHIVNQLFRRYLSQRLQENLWDNYKEKILLL